MLKKTKIKSFFKIYAVKLARDQIKKIEMRLVQAINQEELAMLTWTIRGHRPTFTQLHQRALVKLYLQSIKAQQEKQLIIDNQQ